MVSSVFASGALSPEEILKEQDVTEAGLSDTEVSKRLQQYGKNQLRSGISFNSFKQLLSHFKNPLVIILLVAAGISASMGELTESIIIFVIVLFSVLLDFFEESSAQNAAERLRNAVKNKVRVLRNDKESETDAENIVPGDLIFLSAGKVVPADARIILAKDFFVNQSSLTGESFPGEKIAAQQNSTDTSEIADLTNIVFMGSSVISGSATAVVLVTGMKTQFGQIAAKLIEPPPHTAFNRDLAKFGFLIMRITILLVLFIFAVNTFLKHNFFESFMFAIAVAVGLTPELLPMVMSICMARGSLRMARQGVIVKKLSAIPDFGSMDVLCTDKTGTLTQDHIQLVKYVNPDNQEDENVFRLAWLNSYFQTGIRNPLDEAVLSFRKSEPGETKKFDEIPFDFVRKRMSVVVDDGPVRRLITKGAPEEIFRVCHLFSNSEEEKKAISLYHELSADGFRVIGLATRECTRDVHAYHKEDEAGLQFAGFVAFLDPPKEEALQTIRDLEAIGVEVKIITGDNDIVTKKICGAIGLEIKGMMLGYEMEQITDDALAVRAQETTIFARFSPEQKNRVISALRKAGHTVGYMGDGINDAPSLRNADVGISVNNATDVAKDSASIILTEKNLLVLKYGIEEGRRTFVNTIKYVQMGLSSNFGNMFSVAVAAVALPFLPMLPIQILLNNLLYDLSQVTIPTDRTDKASVQRPQKWNMPFIRRFMLVFGLLSSVFDILTFVLFYKVLHATQQQFQTAWFMESLATQTLVIHVIRTRQIPFIQSTASRQLILSTFFCVLIGWIIPYTIVGSWFHMAPLRLDMLLPIIALVFVYLFLAEVTKHLFYRHFN